MKTLLALILLATSATALAGNWIDDKGRTTTMNYQGGQSTSLSANGREVAEGISAFNSLCIDTAFDKAAVEAAVAETDWGFAYRAEMMPFKEPVDIGGWNTRDAALRMSEGIFFNDKAQCNLTFAPETMVDVTALQMAMSAVLGQEPTNADRQFKRNGKPRRYYAPEWELSAEDGSTFTVFARPSPNNQSALHLSVLRN